MSVIMLAVSSTLAEEVWVPHVIDAGDSGADGVRLADINGDGLLDVTTGWEESGCVAVYLNPGPRHVCARWPKVNVGPAADVEDAVFADLDGDGAWDVVSSTEGDSRTIFVHWAPRDPHEYLNPAAWRTEPVPPSAGRQQWMYALPMQVDGRCGVDLVVGSKNVGATVSWLESPANPRDLSAWRLHKIVDAGWIMSLHGIDVDGDGVEEVVVSDRTAPGQGAYWLQRRGAGTFISHRISEPTPGWMFLDADDFDDDRRVDFVVATLEGGVRGFWGAAGRPSFRVAGPYNKAVAVGDVDRDGRPDIVFSRVGEGDEVPLVGWIGFAGEFGASEPRLTEISRAGSKYDRIELVDLDGDGDLDALTCEENAGVDSRGLGVLWFENPAVPHGASVKLDGEGPSDAP